ncbi:hypothetical protein [Pseudoxanthomonas dokdonensis]|nr:hypothetical protein [Pseudoxanthomonas dokdonensis]
MDLDYRYAQGTPIAASSINTDLPYARPGEQANLHAVALIELENNSLGN